MDQRSSGEIWCRTMFSTFGPNTPYFTYLNDVRAVCPMHIEDIPTKEDSDAVSWYSSKELPKDMINS